MGRLTKPELEEYRRKMKRIENLNKIALVDMPNIKMDNVQKALDELNSEIDTFSKAEDLSAYYMIRSIDIEIKKAK